jgi:hypothetical protein
MNSSGNVTHQQRSSQGAALGRTSFALLVGAADGREGHMVVVVALYADLGTISP